MNFLLDVAITIFLIFLLKTKLLNTRSSKGLPLSLAMFFLLVFLMTFLLGLYKAL